ncbi:HAD family hydrolase [Clostridium paraputrificum]|uniref:HAD family hydrolase n=1 Tax=Clostridium paraputrificum TaxID=29363 RepID=UPI003D338159
MIKNIIFDLGRVVLDFEPKKYLMDKIKDEVKVNKLMKVIFAGEEWIRLDEGTITEDEAIERICAGNIELEKEIRMVFDNWYPMLTPIESTIEVINELKIKGYKLYFLSNFHEKAFKYVNEEYPVFKLFDGGIASYKEKLMKPNPEVYKLILEKYNLKAEECVFIDDVRENVEIAEKFGIKGINLTDQRTLKSDLELIL